MAKLVLIFIALFCVIQMTIGSNLFREKREEESVLTEDKLKNALDGLQNWAKENWATVEEFTKTHIATDENKKTVDDLVTKAKEGITTGLNDLKEAWKKSTGTTEGGEGQ